MPQQAVRRASVIRGITRPQGEHTHNTLMDPVAARCKRFASRPACGLSHSGVLGLALENSAHASTLSAAAFSSGVTIIVRFRFVVMREL